MDDVEKIYTVTLWGADMRALDELHVNSRVLPLDGLEIRIPLDLQGKVTLITIRTN